MTTLYVKEVAAQAISAVASDVLLAEGGTVLELIAETTDVGTGGTVDYDIETRYSPTGAWVNIYTTQLTTVTTHAVSIGPNAPSAKPLGYQVRCLATTATDSVTHGYGLFIR